MAICHFVLVGSTKPRRLARTSRCHGWHHAFVFLLSEIKHRMNCRYLLWVVLEPCLVVSSPIHFLLAELEVRSSESHLLKQKGVVTNLREAQKGVPKFCEMRLLGGFSFR